MATQYKFIKVRIGYGIRPSDGKEGNIYPAFNQVPAVLRADMDWAYFWNAHGTDWQYSNQGHGEGDEPDYWYGIVGLPADFVDDAAARFPEDVTILTESEIEQFWNLEAHADDEDEMVNPETLQAIAAKKQLGMKLSPQDRKALDPEDTTRGIVTNPKKTWARYKAKHDIEVV